MILVIRLSLARPSPGLQIAFGAQPLVGQLPFTRVRIAVSVVPTKVTLLARTPPTLASALVLSAVRPFPVELAVQRPLNIRLILLQQVWIELEIPRAFSTIRQDLRRLVKPPQVLTSAWQSVRIALLAILVVRIESG